MKWLDVSLAPCHTAKALIGSFQPEIIKKYSRLSRNHPMEFKNFLIYSQNTFNLLRSEFHLNDIKIQLLTYR
jgi:hypothetical protein